MDLLAESMSIVAAMRSIAIELYFAVNEYTNLDYDDGSRHLAYYKYTG